MGYFFFHSYVHSTAATPSIIQSSSVLSFYWKYPYSFINKKSVINYTYLYL